MHAPLIASLLISVLLLLSFDSSSAASPGPDKVKQQKLKQLQIAEQQLYQRLSSTPDDGSEVAIAASEYQLLLPLEKSLGIPSDADSTSAASAQSIFERAGLLAFYGNDPRAAMLQLRLYQWLDQYHRHFGTDSKAENWVAVYRNLIATRRFKAAAQHRGQQMYVGAETLPRILVSKLIKDQPTVLRVLDGHTMRRESFALSGKQIIVIAHPLCHFSNNLQAYIAARPDLKKRFAHTSFWLTPPGALNLPEHLAWQQKHPWMRFGLAYLQSEWPWTVSWSTPHILFLQDGKIVKHIQGWPENPTREARDLEAALED